MRMRVLELQNVYKGCFDIYYSICRIHFSVTTEAEATRMVSCFTNVFLKGNQGTYRTNVPAENHSGYFVILLIATV